LRRKTQQEVVFPSPQASQHFSITATLNTGNTQKAGVFPPPLTTEYLIDFRSTAIDDTDTPAPFGGEKPERK
jgi:hypothetical protein